MTGARFTSVYVLLLFCENNFIGKKQKNLRHHFL